MNVLKKVMIFMSFFSYFLLTTDASASALTESSQSQLSDSIPFTKTISYDRKYYSMNIYESGEPVPGYLWVTSGLYSGSLPVKSWYISKTHYVVTYSGNLLKGPYVPTFIIQDIDNLEGGTLNE